MSPEFKTQYNNLSEKGKAQVHSVVDGTGKGLGMILTILGFLFILSLFIKIDHPIQEYEAGEINQEAQTEVVDNSEEIQKLENQKLEIEKKIEGLKGQPQS